MSAGLPLCKQPAQVFGERKGILQPRIGTDKKKLLSPPSPKGVGLPYTGKKEAGNANKHFITDVVTEGIVDVLEIIDIEHDHGKTVTVTG